MHGDRMIGYVVPGGIDVDAMKDLEYLQYYIRDNQSDIYDYLKEHYQTLDEMNK